MDVSGRLYLREKNTQHSLKRRLVLAGEVNHGYFVVQTEA